MVICHVKIDENGTRVLDCAVGESWRLCVRRVGGSGVSGCPLTSLSLSASAWTRGLRLSSRLNAPTTNDSSRGWHVIS